MIAFQISELDVQRTVKDEFNVELTDDQAIAVQSLLNQQLVSDMANFHGDDGDDDALNEATDRACANIVWQIRREPQRFAHIFTW